MSRTFRACVVAVFGVSVASARAQQANIPLRSVRISASADSGHLQSVSQMRVLSDGRAIVNDPVGLRLVLLDASLKRVTVLAGDGSGRNVYGARASKIIPYVGDSTLFLDIASEAAILIDPRGQFGRTMALPQPARDMQAITGTAFVGVDTHGNLVYQVRRRPPVNANVPSPASIPADGANKPIVSSTNADSGAIVRVNFTSRQLDTIAILQLPVTKFVRISPRQGAVSGAGAFNPLPMTDDWTLLPDGTIAIVRTRDYHMDWVAPDGRMSATARMPFDWKRISAEAKQALLDSLVQVEKARRGSLPPVPGQLPFITVDAQDLGDYYPPVRGGYAKAAPDGRVWILPSTSTHSTGSLTGGSATVVGAAGSGLVYDVINRKGEIEERVRLPQGRVLMGFSPDGALYLAYAPKPALAIVERGEIVR